MAAMAAQPGPPRGRVVFLGDSITQDGRYVEFIEAFLLTRHAEQPAAIIKLGLASETVSGLTEHDHPFPRPNLHDRLDRALEITRPDVVVACYGMNDGIYHPFSEVRFAAYREGIARLRERVRKAGARLVLLTPPPFDPAPKQAVARDLGAADYSYKAPYRDYDFVLARYARWLVTLRAQGVEVIDVHSALLQFLSERRKTDPGFVLSKDGIHPGAEGHGEIARTILRAWGFPITGDEISAREEKVRAFIHEKWAVLGPALLKEVGHKRASLIRALPLDDAQRQAASFEAQARSEAHAR